MPDLRLYATAMLLAAGASALVALAGSWRSRRHAEPREDQHSAPPRVVTVMALAAGLVVGYCVLRQRIAWPPSSALDRFLTLVLPAALVIELLAALPHAPRWLSWSLRGALVASMGRILWHGSVYVSAADSEWTPAQTFAALLICAALTAALWGLLAWLAQRSPPGGSLPLALSVTLACGGAEIMLAGYIQGGAATLPICAALVGVVAALGLFAKTPNMQAPIGIGVVGLSGLLFIGRFFGGLTTGVALVLLGAPLLCWLTELPWLRRRPRWLVGALRLALVAIPLVILLVLAKREFDRETAPLLTWQPTHGRGAEVMSPVAANEAFHVTRECSPLAVTAGQSGCNSPSVFASPRSAPPSASSRRSMAMIGSSAAMALTTRQLIESSGGAMSVPSQ